MRPVRALGAGDLERQVGVPFARLRGNPHAQVVAKLGRSASRQHQCGDTSPPMIIEIWVGKHGSNPELVTPVIGRVRLRPASLMSIERIERVSLRKISARPWHLWLGPGRWMPYSGMIGVR